MPKIKAIYICDGAGKPIKSVSSAEIIPTGIKGDRYSCATRCPPLYPHIRHVSFIASSGILAANTWLSQQNLPVFTAAETRRNIELEHITVDEINQLVGKTFALGSAVFKGISLCKPCVRPSELTDKISFKEAFQNRGGIRAQVLSVGFIEISDELLLVV